MQKFKKYNKHLLTFLEVHCPISKTCGILSILRIFEICIKVSYQGLHNTPLGLEEYCNNPSCDKHKNNTLSRIKTDYFSFLNFLGVYNYGRQIMNLYK